MSQILIQRYLNELSDLKRVSGAERESVVREAFKSLLKGWGSSQHLVFVPEFEYRTPGDRKRYIDGALVYDIRLPFGYWEAKDAKDKLDDEIAHKFRRGYPQDNIIFEDSREAVLIQDQRLIMRCPVDDANLENLLGQFFKYERPEIAAFRKAVEQFKADLPAVLAELRTMIESAFETNDRFRQASNHFLDHLRITINDSVMPADVREMLIQHVLTEEIFSKVFGNDDFHKSNNIAKELYALEATFFTGNLKWQTLQKLASYYNAITAAAAQIWSHHEKQKFLKVVYEGFYKIYNKKMADRLGVVYTPNEIVRFMVEASDWLCQKHFNRQLIDRDVEILEPAAGTGTFVTELIDYFRGSPKKLRYKYEEELHANEVAILPYYVANLNIEATYAALARQYVEYPNLCFVDTLDSVGGLGKFAGQQEELFGAVSEENYERIRRQNARKISVVVGNPPYNANQLNENENNKNRKYPAIDRRIKATYLAKSTAQKTKLYDMYVRFFRWASDRIHDAGIVAFITNRSYIDAGNFDGFRRAVVGEFDEIYVIDLGGDWKKQGVGGGGNVFGIGTGVAIGFWVRRPSSKLRKARIHYTACPQGSGQEKLAWLAALTGGSAPLETLDFEDIDGKTGYWVDNPDIVFSSELPVASKDVKASKVGAGDKAIFKLYSLGVSTNRDGWLYDHDKNVLRAKVKNLIEAYDEVDPDTEEFPGTIKWSESLKRRKAADKTESYSAKLIRRACYRPFVEKWLYQSPLFIDRPGLVEAFFPAGKENVAICFSDTNSRAEFCVLATNLPTDLHFGATRDGYQQVARFRFENGRRRDNITDWCLQQFQQNYERDSDGHRITKDAIFNYVYGVLHDPSYRVKYALNLKRELPRIPLYPNFWRWANWGEKLLKLHLGYAIAKPWPLKRTDIADGESFEAGLSPKTILKADTQAGVIFVDAQTQLEGIPGDAWAYQLGARSALEWLLDQFSQRESRDGTINGRFDNYDFSKHKEHVIDLIHRVTRISVETQNIIAAMRALRLH